MKSKFAVLPFLVLIVIALLGCSEPEEDLPRLEFSSSMPKEILVGDTTAALSLIKVFVDPRGRQDEVPAYTAFTFESSDTTIIRVVDGRRLVGVAAGTASVSAFDNQAKARTKGGRDVTVKPRP